MSTKIAIMGDFIKGVPYSVDSNTNIPDIQCVTAGLFTSLTNKARIIVQAPVASYNPGAINRPDLRLYVSLEVGYDLNGVYTFDTTLSSEIPYIEDDDEFYGVLEPDFELQYPVGSHLTFKTGEGDYECYMEYAYYPTTQSLPLVRTVDYKYSTSTNTAAAFIPPKILGNPDLASPTKITFTQSGTTYDITQGAQRVVTFVPVG